LINLCIFLCTWWHGEIGPFSHVSICFSHSHRPFPWWQGDVPSQISHLGKGLEGAPVHRWPLWKAKTPKIGSTCLWAADPVDAKKIFKVIFYG
jgi:hypothetical protein